MWDEKLVCFTVLDISIQEFWPIKNEESYCTTWGTIRDVVETILVCAQWKEGDKKDFIKSSIYIYTFNICKSNILNTEFHFRILFKQKLPKSMRIRHKLRIIFILRHIARFRMRNASEGGKGMRRVRLPDPKIWPWLRDKCLETNKKG